MKHKLLLFASILILNFCVAPGSNAQWVPANAGGWCLAVNGTNIYAGQADFGGVYRSTDSGIIWTGVSTNSVGRTNVFAIAVNGSSLFVGTSDSGIFRSMDDGVTWMSASVAIPHDTIYPAIYTLAVSESVLFAGTDSGIFRSTNNGESWTACDSGLMRTQARIIVVNGLNLFAGMSDGLFLSTDNGISWNGAGMHDTSINAFTVSGSKLFAADGEYVFLSTDKGVSWKIIANSQVWPYALATDGTNLFVGTAGLDDFLLSTDDGSTWSVATSGLPKEEVLALAIVGPNIIACTYGSAIYRRPLSDFNQSSVVENTAASSSTALRVFPNPSSGELQILGEQPGEIHLFDLLGRERMNAFTNNAGATMDVSHLEAGMYFLREGNESAKVEIER